MKLIYCILMSAVMFLACGEEVKIIRFEKPEDFKHWRVRKNTKLSISGWPDNHPGSCAKLEMERYQKGAERWPAIIIAPPALPTDWSNAKELVFDIYAETSGILRLSLYGGKAYNQPSFMVNKGRNHIRIALPAGVLEYEDMRGLHFFMEDPDKDYVWYIGDVTLVKYDLATKFRELEARMLKLNFSGNISETVATQLGKAKNNHRALQRMLAVRKPNARKVSDILDVWERQIKYLEFAGQEQALAVKSLPDGTQALFVSSMEKVHQTEQMFLNPPVSNGIIKAAANEGEAVQLILRSPRDLADVRVKVVAEACSDSGNLIPLKAITITPVGYVNCEQPCYAVPRTGWWPDPLLTYADTIDIEAGKWQSFWVEVQVPSTQPAGIYNTELRITDKKGKIADLPLQIEVYPFELPGGTPYPNVFSVFDPDKPIPFTKDDPKRWRRESREMILSHRLNPSSLYGWRPTSPAEAQYLISRGMKSFNIRYGTTNIAGMLNKVYPQYRKTGLDKFAYCYVFDEAQVTKFGEISKILAQIKAAVPGIKFMTTAYDHSLGSDSPLAGMIDIWCPLTAQYELLNREIKAARQRGDRVWWYVACNPLPPYANFLIEQPSLCMRLLTGAMAWKYRTDGLLYYSAALWLHNPPNLAKLPPMSGAPLTNWSGRTFGKFNGDGLLIYPGKDHPVPTIRLKNIRDGLEDYFYYQLLDEAYQNSSQMPESWKKAVAAELQIAPELVKSLSVYTQNPDFLYAKRARLAQLLSKYHNRK